VTQRFDENKWPDLTKFRDACIGEDFDEMQRIANLNHHWYVNENPDNLPMENLARIFQAQWYAGQNNLALLKRIVERYPWTVNHPWTAQGWLPLSQAVSLHGNREMIDFLLDCGADPTLLVGDPDERGTIPDMARWGKNDELAKWLEQIIQGHKTQS
jgi:hypothetical protein